jgi:hypothetical protein
VLDLHIPQYAAPDIAASLLLLVLVLQIMKLYHKVETVLVDAGIWDRSPHHARLLLFCDGDPDDPASYSIKWVLSLDTVLVNDSALVFCHQPRICQGECS